MKKNIFILIITLYIISCNKDVESNDYDSGNLLNKSFISTNNHPFSVISGGIEETIMDTTWYNFNNSSQLTQKSNSLIFFDEPQIEYYVPYPLQSQDTAYFGYTNTILDYEIVNESSIKFTSEQINYPEGFLTNYFFEEPQGASTNSMEILKFNDTEMKVQFNRTLSSGKDTTFYRVLKPLDN